MAKKVLIVEDSQTVSRLTSEIVKNLGGEPDTATSVGEAESKLTNNDYDIVIWDGQLGHETSTELVRRTAPVFGGIMVAHSTFLNDQLMAAGCDIDAPKGHLGPVLQKLLAD